MSNSDSESYFRATSRSCRQVGLFIQWWAIVENQLDNAMSAALGLTVLQQAIVTVNIPVANKIHITTTAVEVAGLDGKKVKHYKRHLKKLWSLNDGRNMMVHYVFGPTKDEKATIFSVTEARGRLKFPEVIWTTEDFNKSYKQMKALDEKLGELTKELKAAAPRNKLAELLMTTPAPKPENVLLAEIGLQNPPTPKRKRSARIISSSQKSPQTPPTAEG